jgi:peptide/nickel transport system permease protein
MSVDAKRAEKVAKLADGGERPKSESLFQKAIRRLWRDRLTMAMFGVLIFLIIFSFSAPLLESSLEVSFRRTNLDATFLPPLSQGYDEAGEPIACEQLRGCFILGTDDLGRDQLSRLARGGQITLAIAFFAALLSLTIGLAVGVLTGYYGGIVDDVVMWIITTLNSIPTLFLLVIIVGLLSPGPFVLTMVLGLLGWTGTTRLVRGETFSMRNREYVISAQATGAGAARIMFRHIAPNLISILVVTLAIDIGSLLLAEAALSFLGLGVAPPTPTWGNMLTKSQDFIRNGNSAHLAIIPGIMITLTVLCFYVIGDGIRDAFDPTLEK